MAEYVTEWGESVADFTVREEVVRCRECEWFDFDICACKRRPLHMAVEPDGFCAWASRKGSE